MKPKYNPFVRSASLAAIVLTLGTAATAASLEWKGSTTGLLGGTNQTWDTNTTANWSDGLSTVNWPALGGTDDDAVFGGTAGSVTITTATANDITFNTTGYTLTGGTLTLNGTTPTISNGAAIDATIASIISGTAGLTKTGDGILTLSGANTYTGVTTISAGILLAGNNAALGSNLDGTTVSSGATLDVGGRNLGAEVVTISGTGVGGNGAIINTGVLQNNALRFVTLAGNATVGGATRWDIRAVGTSTLDLGGFTLTKSGAAYMGVVGTSVTNPGDIIIDGGEMSLSLSTNLNGSAANSITVNNTGTLSMFQSTNAHNWTLNLNTGSTLRGENGNATQNIWAGAVNLAGNVSLLAEPDDNLTIRGNMTGTANIEKTGTGTFVLSGNNTHNSTTTITAGSLQIDHNNALGAGTAITMSGLNNSSLVLGNGVTAGSGKTITISGAGSGTAFGALSTSAGNAGTAEWQGAVTIGATLGTRVGTNDGNLLISGNIGESAAGSELIFRNNRNFSTIFLTGSNSFTGSPQIAVGITSVASIGNSGVNSPLGQNGTIRLGLTTVLGNLTYTGTGETTNKVIDLSSTTGAVAIDHSGTNLLKFTSNFTATGGGAKTLTLQGSTTGTGEIAGAIVDNTGTFRTSILKAGSGTWVLSGTNSYTGGTTVNAGTLKLDYSTNNTSKLSDITSALTLGGGTVELAGGSHTEIVLSTALAANTRSFITRSSGTSVLQLNTVTRNTGATLDFAADNIARIDNTNTNGIIGGWATVGENTWAVNSTNGADGLVTGLASYTLTSAAGNTAASYLNNNMTVDSSQTPAAAITPNSLRFNDANARTLTLATGNNIVTTGGIMVTPTVGANISTITGGTLTLPAAGTLTFHQNNSAGKLVVGSIVANNTGVLHLAKTGAGEVELTNSANTFTGSIAVNAGTLTLVGNQATRAGAITVGNLPGQTATLNIQGDVPLAGQQFNIAAGGLGAVGIVNQSAGTVSFTGGNGILIGQAAGGVSGTYNLSGGTLTTFASITRGVMLGVNDGTAGNPMNATFNLSGTGNLNNSTGLLQVVRGDSTSSFQNSTYNQTGGTATNGTLLIGGNVASGANSTATFSVTGGTFASTLFSNLSRGNNVSSTMTIGGTAVVTLPAFPTARGNGSTATLHFDGGTLRPIATSTAYLGGLTNAFIQDGGARFDTNAFDITVSQNLLTHDTSTGGGLTKQGAGILTLTGTNTYTGQTTVSGGTLVAGNTAAFGAAGRQVNLNSGVNGGTVEFATDTSANAYVLAMGSAAATSTVVVNRATAGTDMTHTLGTALLGQGGTFNVQKGALVSGTGTLALAGLTLSAGSAGTTTLNPTTANLTIGAVTAGGTANAKVLRLDGTSAGNLITGIISNGTGTPVSLNKTNTSTWGITNANTYTGLTTVGGGVLTIGNNAGLGSTAGDTTVTSGSLRLANGVTVTGETILIAGTGIDFNGALQADAGATAEWAGTVRINSAAARVGAGIGGTLTLSGAIVDNAAFNVLNIGPGVGGTGTVIVSAASGTNTYTGNTTITRGTLKLGADNTLPTGSILDIDTANAAENAIFDLAGFNQTVAGLQRTNAAGGAGTGIITNSGAADKTLTINQAGTSQYSGSIEDGATNKTIIVKGGAGTLTLSGTNTYTGATSVSAGTLAVSAAGSINTTSGISVAAGAQLIYNSSTALTVSPALNGAGTSSRAVLGGTGPINAAVTLNDLGDTLAPGNSPGIQTFTPAQTWSSFSYDWELNNFITQVPGTNHDQLSLDSTLDLNGGVGAYQLNVLGLTAGNLTGAVPDFTEANQQWTILTSVGAITGFDAANWTINTSGFSNNTPFGGNFTLTSDTNNVFLNYNAIPEPSAALLAALGSLMLFRRRRVA